MHNLSKTHLPTFPPEFTFHIGWLRKVKKNNNLGKLKERGGRLLVVVVVRVGGGVFSIMLKADMSKLNWPHQSWVIYVYIWRGKKNKGLGRKYV